MPAASYAFLPNLKKGLFFAIGEGYFVACFLHSSAQMCLYQAPGPRAPRITGRAVKTVTIRWVRVPNVRAPLTFHGVVVGFVHRCLSNTRNLAASNYHLADFSQADLGPTSVHDVFFLAFFEFGTCFWKISGHSDRYRKRMAGIFEIQTCLVTSRFRCHRSNSTLRYQSIYAIHVPASLRTQVPLESYVRRRDEAPGAMQTYPRRFYPFSAKVWALRAFKTPP